MVPQAYPLHWPQGFPRTKTPGSAQFKSSLSAALKNVRKSLEMFGKDTEKRIREVTLSSNVTLGSERPDDAGVAVWFIWDEEWRCIPVDRYAKPEWNLQAIHHILEARRVEFRHGGLQIAKSAFSGFTLALSAPGSHKTWRQIMGYGPSEKPSELGLKSAYKELCKTRHPDKPTGSSEKMSELNNALQMAKSELGYA